MYNNLSKDLVLKIYFYAMEQRKKGLGQRKIYHLIKNEFNEEIKENTISNWIFYGKVPFANEKTQFKPLPMPAKDEINELYLIKKQSSQEIAKKYGVSTIIVINWLKKYHISVRNHKESMNTSIIKNILREKKLKRPTKEFSRLSVKKAYLLGALCGDGHINPKFIRFEIRNDEEFIREFSNCIENVYGIKFNYNYYPKRNSFVLYASCELICSDLLNYGNFYTFTWNVPKEILISSEEKIIGSFLRGIFDSDGSASKYCISLVSASKKGIKGVSKLLDKLDIKNKIVIIRKKYYGITVTGKERLKRFKEKIGFKIKRKLEKLK